jgi:Ion channel
VDRVARRRSAGDARLVRVERHRYGLLLITLFVSLGVQGIAPHGRVQQLVVTAFAGAAVALAVRAAGLPAKLVRLAAAFALLVLALSAVRALVGGVGEGAALLMNAALVSLGPPAVAIGVLGDLRTSGQVRITAVMGVLSLYLLLGMFFAFTYAAIDELGRGSFFTDIQDATASQCLYFSFTTLTTVGFGDLVARTDLGHTLAVLEALIGQIYLVTVVSLIVSNLGFTRRTQAAAPRE